MLCRACAVLVLFSITCGIDREPPLLVVGPSLCHSTFALFSFAQDQEDKACTNRNMCGRKDLHAKVRTKTCAQKGQQQKEKEVKKKRSRKRGKKNSKKKKSMSGCFHFLRSQTGLQGVTRTLVCVCFVLFSPFVV